MGEKLQTIEEEGDKSHTRTNLGISSIEAVEEPADPTFQDPFKPHTPTSEPPAPEQPEPSEAGRPSTAPRPAVKAEEDWEAWSYEQCTLKLKRQSKFPPAIFRLAQLLNSEYNKPEEAQ